MIARTDLKAVSPLPTYGWDWKEFHGSADGLKWNRRDLAALDLVLTRVPRRRAVVQAGGNLGIFPKRLAETFEAVYTFEPDPRLFAALCHNAPESNIVKVQAALGDGPALVATSMKRRLGHLKDHEGLAHIAGQGIIPTLRLDDFWLPVCDLIYLDIEGWETFALNGAVETIRSCRPVLAVEVSATAHYVGLTPDELRDQILGYGYRLAMRVLSDEVFLPTEAA